MQIRQKIIYFANISATFINFHHLMTRKMPSRSKKCGFCPKIYKSTKILANHIRAKHPNDSASGGAAEGAAENTPPDSPALPSAIAVSSLPPPPLTPNDQPEATTTRVTHVSLEDFVNYKNNITNTINAFTTAAFEEFSAQKRRILDITSENAVCML